MARLLDSGMSAGLTAKTVAPAVLAMLTFKTGVRYVHSGIGDLLWGSNTYQGIGSLGKLGVISEGTDVKADGTSLQLSGIDPTLLSESMADVKVGAPAKVWLALFDRVTGAMLGAPYPMFVGMVDAPQILVGGDTVTISLPLESRLSNLQRPRMQRYTAADQRRKYPTDSGFNWVESLNSQSMRWGS